MQLLGAESSWTAHFVPLSDSCQALCSWSWPLAALNAFSCSVCSERAVWVTEPTSRSVFELGTEARLAADLPASQEKEDYFPTHLSSLQGMPSHSQSFWITFLDLLFRMNNTSSHLSRGWGCSRNHLPALSTLPGSAAGTGAGAGRSLGTAVLGIAFDLSTRKEKNPTLGHTKLLSFLFLPGFLTLGDGGSPHSHQSSAGDIY